MNKKLLWLLVAVLLGGQAMAAEDLVQAYQLAEQQDPVLKGTEAGYAAVQELKPQARARLMLPVIGATGNTFYNTEDVSVDNGSVFGLDGDSEFNTRGYAINLTQPVYHYYRYVQLQQATGTLPPPTSPRSTARW